jgi:putative ATP-dependent endonuclease of OLD family
MRILIDKVRVSGFRGLNNIELDLEQVTVLTGMNNTGKTSLLKALQIVLGNRQFISPEDFCISQSSRSEKIIIDIRIIPISPEGTRSPIFNPDWEILFTENRIINDTDGNQFIPLRTTVTFEPIKNTYKTKQYIQQEWVEFQSDAGVSWYESDLGIEQSFHFDEIPFFYMDAQRDIIEDIKVRNSYFGKMISQIKYSAEDVAEIEAQITQLNKQAVESSDILTDIELTLKELDTAMDNTKNGVDITPFPKKIRDLNKGVSIQYSDFSMEYHGMGTRSWSSLLTLKSFISLFSKISENNSAPFFPILAIEEPEAHLHPNAQKKLHGQIASIKGQKIISTHSPYIAASAELDQIRSFYKGEDNIICGKIDTSVFLSEDIRKIKRQVINTKGELFFSRIIVLVEGETEEQALPIFAEKFFGKTSAEIGIDFVGVGGQGNYSIFIRLAESLKIKWFILSDAENTPDNNIKAKVQKQFLECVPGKIESDHIIFLNDGNDFEKELINGGYQEEIKEAIVSFCHNVHHANSKRIEIADYDADKLYQILTGGKTQYGPAVAEAIVQSEKDIPSKIKILFEKINSTINT